MDDHQFTYGRAVAPVVSEIWNIGDCAAMVAPLTGDGMAMRLRSAELATQRCCAFWQESLWNMATAEYARRWQGEFLPRLRWGRGWKPYCFSRLASLLEAVHRMPGSCISSIAGHSNSCPQPVQPWKAYRNDRM